MSRAVISSASAAPAQNKQTKIKRIVSTWQKFARSRKVGTSGSSSSSSASPIPPSMEIQRGESYEDTTSNSSSSSSSGRKLPDEDTFVVYVGKEKRRYVLGEHYLNMPLFRSLLEKSNAAAAARASAAQPDDHNHIDGLYVPCEVVMFEHLLWMLDSGNPALQHAESVDELVEFYAY